MAYPSGCAFFFERGMKLIDFEKLQQAYRAGAVYSLQLEVGDRCEQGCIFCYMNAVPTEKNTLSDSQIQTILHAAREIGITSVEWLGGEPLLRPGIFEHMALAAELGLRNNIWTGGLPLADKKILANSIRYGKNGLISVHISTVNPTTYSKLHPGRAEKNLNTILQAVEEILNRGYPPTQMLNSVTFTGLQSAADMIETIDFFEENYGIATSLNVYHTYLRPGTDPGELSKFIPKPAEVARVYKRYARQQGATQLPMNCVNKQYCSATMAVLCDGKVTPCATIRESTAPTIHDLDLRAIFETHHEELTFARFHRPAQLPRGCQKCSLSHSCWGCRSRSYAAGNGLYGPDPRCFRAN